MVDFYLQSEDLFKYILETKPSGEVKPKHKIHNMNTFCLKIDKIRLMLQFKV